jgi:hypothetical protein
LAEFGARVRFEPRPLIHHGLAKAMDAPFQKGLRRLGFPGKETMTLITAFIYGLASAV